MDFPVSSDEDFESDDNKEEYILASFHDEFDGEPENEEIEILPIKSTAENKKSYMQGKKKVFWE